MRIRRSFALLLTLYLVAMLAAGGASLAFTALAETALIRWSGNDLDHRLLIESLLTCLPHLLKHDSVLKYTDTSERNDRPVVVDLPGGRVAFLAVPGGGRLVVPSQPQASPLRRRLEELARAHGLKAENIHLAPVVTDDGVPLQRYYWFDQVLTVTEFEEVFRWRFYSAEEVGERPAAWSDLISFWNIASGELRSLELETTVGVDTRRWFLVVQLEPEKARTVCLQPI